MTYLNENLVTRMLHTLSLPLLDRCAELTLLFDHCSLRELQEVFPAIVHSIFGVDGGVSWGLRTTTEQLSPNLFSFLHQFFTINGVILRICYRLLTDTIKFEVDIDLLPHKVVTMLQSGQYSLFYVDLLNVDPFRRQLVSLSLNAFDYYMLHFVLHALQPLHRVNPIALRVNNERIKSVYYLLVADYLNNFMPGHPDSEVLPNNTSPGVKSPQPIPVQALKPKRGPRYLKIPSTYNNNSSISGVNTVVSTGNPCAHAWRTESVLHFFIDNWLRVDIEGEHDLPGSEFVRSVRILIKQVHFFANSAILDMSSITQLRKIALPMVKARIYPFLKALMDRWPLDNSMIVVLELWLSYIQPWRYTSAHNQIKGDVLYEPRITTHWDTFIADNLIIYTHMFIRILPRFQRLDYKVYRNALMLDRLWKTIAQPSLGFKIKEIEKVYSGNTFGLDSPKRNSDNIRLNVSNSNSYYDADWSPLYNETIQKMFSESTRKEVENFLLILKESLFSILECIRGLQNKIQEKRLSQGFFKSLLYKWNPEHATEEQRLNELVRIPDILKQAMLSFSILFEVNISFDSIDVSSSQESFAFSQEVSHLKSNDFVDISKLSRIQTYRNIGNIHLTVDPALLPIQSNEIPIFVRSLQLISNKVNKLFGTNMQSLYARNDFIGKVCQQILNAPMTEKWFDKRFGCSDLFENRLPPRLCLRPLASVQVIVVILSSLLVGFVLWNSPFSGLLFLCLFYIAYILVLALIY